jgi:putative transposase
MPDHVHALFYLPEQEELDTIVRRWKSWTARMHGVQWQKRFFDHRVRHDESAEEKWQYIQNNPVRAGLVEAPDYWPHVWIPPREQLMNYF